MSGTGAVLAGLTDPMRDAWRVVETSLSAASDWVWGPWLLVLLFGTHLFLTIRLGLVQRHLPQALRLSFMRKPEGEGEISHFGALMTALAATVGTGNIVGVATAVAGGGPGAVLWMWLTGVFGIATKYGEAVLAVKYRVIDEKGRVAGGPMYVLERGLGLRPLGIVFAALTAVAAFGIGNMVQAHSIASLLEAGRLAIPPRHSGAVMAALAGIVILGGVRSIARVCGLLVPFMAVFYIGGCLILLGMGASQLPETIRLILRSAVTGEAAAGGLVGVGIRETIRYGVARGLFSNESGLGSAPIVAAAAQTKDPVRQALVSSTGTFWDTVVVCLLTGLVIVNTGAWQTQHEGAAMTRHAFASLGAVGLAILTVGMLTFVFSTILGWSYYGEKAVEYLLGPRAILPYRVLWVAAVFLGAQWKLRAVWDFADVANGLMAVPNLIALLALSGVVARETRAYLGRNAQNRASTLAG